MDKKQLQEKIKAFVAKKLKEQSGFATGAGMAHTGKKPQNEEAKKDIPKPAKQYKGPTLAKAPRKQSQQPAVFSKGAKDLSTYTRMGYRTVKPSEMIDAKYLWSGRAGKKKENILPIGENLNEARYSQFKKQTEIVNPSSQMHVAMKEIKKRLQEINKITSYTKQLKTELSETSQVEYNKRTEVVMETLMKEIASLYKNLKELKNG